MAQRRAEGGAAPAALAAMIADLREVLAGIGAAAAEREAGFAEAEEALLERARAVVGS